MRHLITKNLTLKFSPELKFLLDDTFDQIDETRRLLAQDNVKRDLDRDPDKSEDDDGENA